MKSLKILFATLCVASTQAIFADIVVPMHFTSVNGQEASAGTITISQTPHGVLFTPNLTDLTTGIHGFHLHQNPSCNNNGMAAGGHFDPENTGKHAGPYSDQGHLGDLPALYVNADGTATLPVLAPRLTQVNEIENHALMIHAGGDNYSDVPAPLGGGGGRMVCGEVITTPQPE